MKLLVLLLVFTACSMTSKYKLRQLVVTKSNCKGVVTGIRTHTFKETLYNIESENCGFIQVRESEIQDM